MCERAGDPQRALASAIDALDAVDPNKLTDSELHGLVMALEAEESRLAAMWPRVLAARDRTLQRPASHETNPS
jgi:hypothetical protein